MKPDTEKKAQNDIQQPEYARLAHLYAAELARLLLTDQETTDARIIEENIFSLRRTVETGRHDVVFDPASGRDALRLLLAYNPRRLMVVESFLPVLQESKELLLKYLTAGKVAFEEASRSPTVTEISFVLDTLPRTVLFVNEDARDAPLPEMDVWHSYLPTGAEQETEKQRDARRRGEDTWIPDDTSPIVHEGFSGALSWEVYSHVRTGGFIVRNEDGVLGHDLFPAKLGEILGLRELPIAGRHNYTVLTAYHSEVQKSEYPGIITQKTRALEREQFLEAQKVIEAVRSIFFLLKSFEGMQLYYFEDAEGSITHPIDIVLDLERDLRADLEELLPVLEQQPEKVREAIEECIAVFREKVAGLQVRLRRFFEKLDKSPSQDPKYLRELFSIRTIDALTRSDEYPFAVDLLQSDVSFRAALKELADFTYDV